MKNMTMQMEKLADVVVGSIQKAITGPRIAGRFDRLDARIQALEQQVIDLDTKSIKFRGVWRDTEAESYGPGDATIRQGSCGSADTPRWRRRAKAPIGNWP